MLIREVRIPTEEEPIAKTAEPEISETPAEVSFSAQVTPIFAAKCNFCHHPDNAVKVDLTQPFDPEVGIINRPNSWTQSEKTILVAPGDPESSALIQWRDACPGSGTTHAASFRAADLRGNADPAGLDLRRRKGQLT